MPVAQLTGLIVFLISWFFAQVQADCREAYFINGKEVSASTYQAGQLVQNSLDMAKKGRVLDAVTTLKRALMLAPALPQARTVLGVMLARLGKVDEASEQLRMAIAADRTLAPPRLNLAVIYESQGDIEAALEIYHKFLVDCPGDDNVPVVKDRYDLLSREAARRRKVRQSSGRRAWSADDYFADAVEGGIKRWSATRMPLRVYIVTGADQLACYQPGFDKILRDSFAEWQTASAGKVKFVFLSPANRRDADIVCQWVDDADGLQSQAENGETKVQAELGTIQKAHITLVLTDKSAFPLTRNLVRTLCLHETGHSLGVLGHSTSPEDVMFSIMPMVEREQHLSERDKATLRLLYDHDLDWFSIKWEELQKKTAGNAVNLVAFAVFILLLVIAVLLAVWRVQSLVGGKPKKRRKK